MTPAAYQAAVTLIGRRVSALLARQWQRVDRAAIATTWQRLLPVAVEIVTTGQRAAAELADPYLDVTVGPGDGAALVVPAALAGRTLDGRTLQGLLTLPQIETLDLISRGVTPAQALQRGAERLTLYARTATTDSARQAVAAGMGARKVAGYYRRLSLPSCARCAILAGRWYRSNEGFQRHPRCDCVHVPADDPGGPGYDARQAVQDGQVTGLSQAEAAAIEHGADPAAVVNARRGMATVAGGRKVTTEGTTRRGAMRGRRARPTPEQILADATSRDDAIRLLTTYGYIR